MGLETEAPPAKSTKSKTMPLKAELQVAAALSEKPKTHGAITNQIPNKILIIFT